MNILPPPRTTAERPPSTAPHDNDAGDAAGMVMNADTAADVACRLAATINSVLAGKAAVVDVAVATLLARGHLLIEDIPGVGKTLLAQVIARSVGGSFRRIQGTSDLLPGDVTGSMVPGSMNADGAMTSLVFRPGPVFANVVVFDELNRTTPRTQSALLELTEEAQVSVDGVSHPLPDPFMLVATQNPFDIAGTSRLGEGSLDRFAAVVTPGRAPTASEIDVLVGRQGRTMLDAVRPVASLDELTRVQSFASCAHVADVLAEYVVALLDATRQHPAIRLGASTRGGVLLLALARARAVMHGRTYVISDDIAALAVPALAHRIVLADANSSLDNGRTLMAECLAAVPPPTV
ncbi:MAG: MoxR-like ATPase [Ilumatobacter sp.]